VRRFLFGRSIFSSAVNIAAATGNESGVGALKFRDQPNVLELIMGITRAVIGAVAAVGIARLLAPKETKMVMKTAERTVRDGVKAAKRKATSMTKAAGSASPRKTAGKVRKAAKRPARKASR